MLNPVSLLPQSGRLDSDLGLPISDGDVVHLYDRDKQSYVEHHYPSKKWDIDPPIIAVGEAFWVGKTTPVNWVQRLQA